MYVCICVCVCVYACILKVYSINYTLRKNKCYKIGARYKECSFFLSSAHYSFSFNSRFLYKLKHKVRLSKSLCWIFPLLCRFYQGYYSSFEKYEYGYWGSWYMKSTIWEVLRRKPDFQKTLQGKLGSLW